MEKHHSLRRVNVRRSSAAGLRQTIFLAMRNVPDLGWTYRIIGLGAAQRKLVLDLVIEYRGFNLFTDRPSPRGDKVLLVDEYPPGSSWNSEFSLASLITERANRRAVGGDGCIAAGRQTPRGRRTAARCCTSWPAAYETACLST